MIPVGPYPIYKEYLQECLDSVLAQTLLPAEILLIDDMAGLPQGLGHSQAVPIRTWRAPWRLGDVGAFNCGVALAENDLVFMLSCDDRIRPECLELCVAEWEKNQRKDAYYYVGCHYIDDVWPDQTIPFSGSMVTKGLWKLTGGFPVETTGHGGDAALISILMTYFPDLLVPVAGGRPLYDYRTHNGTQTANGTPWAGVMIESRKLATNLWKPPVWGRME